MKQATGRIRPALGPLKPLKPLRPLKMAALLVTGALLALAATAAGGDAAGSGSAERPNMTPGQWEITVVMEMEGMPPRPPITSTQCIKPEEIKDARSFAGTVQRRGGKCTIGDLKLTGGKLSYTFSCEHGATGETEVSFAGTSYEATTKMTSPGRGSGPLKLQQHTTAKRTGDC